MKLDRKSQEWRHIESWADEQIAAQRDLIEDSTMTIEYTQFHRGFVAALRALKNLPDADASRVISE